MNRMQHIKFVESEMVVDCPRRIQRAMLRNLRTAVRVRTNGRLAKRAAELLAAAEAEPAKKIEHVTVTPATAKIPSSIAPLPKATEKKKWRWWRDGYVGFKKYAGRVKEFVKRCSRCSMPDKSR